MPESDRLSRGTENRSGATCRWRVLVLAILFRTSRGRAQPGDHVQVGTHSVALAPLDLRVLLSSSISCLRGRIRHLHQAPTGAHLACPRAKGGNAPVGGDERWSDIEASTVSERGFLRSA